MTMKFALGLFAATALTVAVGTASAEDKILAIVVKGLDNPFFEQIHLGCEKANGELKGTGYTCLYTGPASSTDEAGEVQIVDDLLNRDDIMTIDADLGKDDAALRKTYLGTDNYLMGVKFAEYLQKVKPKGGKICLQLGNVAADNINARAAGT